MLKHILPIALAISLAGEAVMAATIEMVVDGKVYQVQLEDHATAQDFMSRLPMTLVFENFGQTERIAYLKNALKIGNAPTSTTPVVGDFAYYIPWGNVCVFIKDFRHSSDLVPMGKMSKEATEAVRKSAERTVTFRAIQK